MPLASRIIAQNRYALRGTAADFAVAAAALAARVQSQGHPGVLSYQFHTGAGLAGASVTYADAVAWIGHHDIAMAWPEMQALHGVARLEQITLLGPVTQGMRDWLVRGGLTAAVTELPDFAAGFVR